MAHAKLKQGFAFAPRSASGDDRFLQKKPQPGRRTILHRVDKRLADLVHTVMMPAKMPFESNRPPLHSKQTGKARDEGTGRGAVANMHKDLE
jgi:hypothetical protein